MAAIASRYARAFADSIFERKQDAQVASRQLHDMLALLESSQPLREVWENPSVPAEQKRAVLDAIARKTAMPQLVRNFLAVIIDHRRVAQLPEIALQFDAEINGRLGMAEAEVISARELSPGERSQVEARIKAVTGTTIRATYKTDRNLLGGALIKIGSTIYDGSVRGQLQRLKEELVAGA